MPNRYLAPCTAVEGHQRLVGACAGASWPGGDAVYEGGGRLIREGAIQDPSPCSLIEAPPPPPTKWPTPPTECTRRRPGRSSASVPPPDRLRRRLGQGGHCGRRRGSDCRCVAGGVTSGGSSASSVRRAGEGKGTAPSGPCGGHPWHRRQLPGVVAANPLDGRRLAANRPTTPKVKYIVKEKSSRILPAFLTISSG